ncbi:unnamed protein product [Amoebophrya sp. A120]|nr:unnamed protein product [Amoebophrya sp. A120]|eukprot:GSA120T00005236001.1
MPSAPTPNRSTSPSERRRSAAEHRARNHRRSAAPAGQSIYSAHLPVVLVQSPYNTTNRSQYGPLLFNPEEVHEPVGRGSTDEEQDPPFPVRTRRRSRGSMQALGGVQPAPEEDSQSPDAPRRDSMQTLEGQSALIQMSGSSGEENQNAHRSSLLGIGDQDPPLARLNSSDDEGKKSSFVASTPEQGMDSDIPVPSPGATQTGILAGEEVSSPAAGKRSSMAALGTGDAEQTGVMMSNPGTPEDGTTPRLAGNKSAELTLTERLKLPQLASMDTLAGNNIEGANTHTQDMIAVAYTDQTIAAPPTGAETTVAALDKPSAITTEEQPVIWQRQGRRREEPQPQIVAEVAAAPAVVTVQQHQGDAANITVEKEGENNKKEEQVAQKVEQGKQIAAAMAPSGPTVTLAATISAAHDHQETFLQREDDLEVAEAQRDELLAEAAAVEAKAENNALAVEQQLTAQKREVEKMRAEAKRILAAAQAERDELLANAEAEVAHLQLKAEEQKRHLDAQEEELKRVDEDRAADKEKFVQEAKKVLVQAEKEREKILQDACSTAEDIQNLFFEADIGQEFLNLLKDLRQLSHSLAAELPVLGVGLTAHDQMISQNAIATSSSSNSEADEVDQEQMGGVTSDEEVDPTAAKNPAISREGDAVMKNAPEQEDQEQDQSSTIPILTKIESAEQAAELLLPSRTDLSKICEQIDLLLLQAREIHTAGGLQKVLAIVASSQKMFDAQRKAELDRAKEDETSTDESASGHVTAAGLFPVAKRRSTNTQMEVEERERKIALLQEENEDLKDKLERLAHELAEKETELNDPLRLADRQKRASRGKTGSRSGDAVVQAVLPSAAAVADCDAASALAALDLAQNDAGAPATQTASAEALAAIDGSSTTNANATAEQRTQSMPTTTWQQDGAYVQLPTMTLTELAAKTAAVFQKEEKLRQKERQLAERALSLSEEAKLLEQGTQELEQLQEELHVREEALIEREQEGNNLMDAVLNEAKGFVPPDAHHDVSVEAKQLREELVQVQILRANEKEMVLATKRHIDQKYAAQLELQVAKSKSRDLVDKLTDADIAKLTAQKELESVRAMLDQTEKSKNALVSELQLVEEKLEIAQSAVQNAQADIEKLLAEVKELETVKQTLQEDLRQSRSDQAEQERKRAEVVEEKLLAEQKLEDLEKQHGKIQQEQAQLVEAKLYLEKLHEERKMEKEELETELGRVKDVMKNTEVAAIADSDGERAKLKQQLEDLRAKHAKAQEELALHVEEKNQKNADMLNHLADMHDLHAEAQGSLDTELQSSKANEALLLQKIADLEAEKNDLQLALHTTQLVSSGGRGIGRAAGDAGGGEDVESPRPPGATVAALPRHASEGEAREEDFGTENASGAIDLQEAVGSQFRLPAAKVVATDGEKAAPVVGPLVIEEGMQDESGEEQEIDGGQHVEQGSDLDPLPPMKEIDTQEESGQKGAPKAPSHASPFPAASDAEDPDSAAGKREHAPTSSDQGISALPEENKIDTILDNADTVADNGTNDKSQDISADNTIALDTDTTKVRSLVKDHHMRTSRVALPSPPRGRRNLRPLAAARRRGEAAEAEEQGAMGALVDDTVRLMKEMHVTEAFSGLNLTAVTAMVNDNVAKVNEILEPMEIVAFDEDDLGHPDSTRDKNGNYTRSSGGGIKRYDRMASSKDDDSSSAGSAAGNRDGGKKEEEEEKSLFSLVGDFAFDVGAAVGEYAGETMTAPTNKGEMNVSKDSTTTKNVASLIPFHGENIVKLEKKSSNPQTTGPVVVLSALPSFLEMDRDNKEMPDLPAGAAAHSEEQGALFSTIQFLEQPTPTDDAPGVGTRTGTPPPGAAGGADAAASAAAQPAATRRSLANAVDEDISARGTTGSGGTGARRILAQGLNNSNRPSLSLPLNQRTGHRRSQTFRIPSSSTNL